ncbi:4Fe-4S dicluster domain-containing protein [Desulfosediminicola flagellatus]|uniref:4Fe-4S dicluster domain-containing protein n=1 Tax=Desulfosediminicola flagellatus TaxID=2569541 RepID=UPI0010AB87AC|nr:4Fe-4S dicluster domain-containing protein [Desulfosediminicola flagellatus]
MLFHVLPKDELASLFEILAINRIVGPTRKAISKDGNPIWAFDWLNSFDELDLEYTSTSQSPKKYFLPYQETLSTFTVNESGWEKNVDYNHYHPNVFFGMHACDINALNRLDKVMLESVYPNPYYAGKRKNMFIIGVGCAPQPHCFCRSMDADSVLHGFDMFLTDIGNKYFVEIQSATAFEILKNIRTTEATNHEHAMFLQAVEERNTRFTCHVDTTDLSKILDMEFKSEEWVKWGDKCLSCGTCANVCPTCYCFGIQESVDIDLKGARKEAHLYSCNLVDFAQVAGGHNFRPESHTRLKYRYYHKHRGFVEAFEEALCVGCGRCGQACLAGITVPEVIGSIRQEAQQND